MPQGLPVSNRVSAATARTVRTFDADPQCPFPPPSRPLQPGFDRAPGGRDEHVTAAEQLVGGPLDQVSDEELDADERGAGTSPQGFDPRGVDDALDERRWAPETGPGQIDLAGHAPGWPASQARLAVCP